MQLPNNALTSKLLAVAVQAITVVQSGAKAIGDAITALHLPEKVVTNHIFRVGMQAVVAGTAVAGLAGVAVGSVAGLSAALGTVGLAALSPFVPAIGGVAAIAVADDIDGTDGELANDGGHVVGHRLVREGPPVVGAMPVPRPVDADDFAKRREILPLLREAVVEVEQPAVQEEDRRSAAEGLDVDPGATRFDIAAGLGRVFVRERGHCRRGKSGGEREREE